LHYQELTCRSRTMRDQSVGFHWPDLMHIYARQK